MHGNDITTAQVRGREVYDSAGNRVGNIEDVTFNADALRITGFIVKMDREAAARLNVAAPLLGSARLEVSADRLASLGDSVLLNVDQREMAGMLYDSRL